MLTSTSYLSDTSNEVAQAYMLASKVKTKLTEEAVKSNINLVKLVTQANLLDKLIENINHLQYGNDTSKFTFESINENMYPLLSTSNNFQYQNLNNTPLKDTTIYAHESGDEDDVRVEIKRIHTDDQAGSDESDFDSDSSYESNNEDDNDDDNDSSFAYQASFNGPLESYISHDRLCDSLDKLNFYQGLVEETDPSLWNNNNNANQHEIAYEVVSDSESVSSTFSSDENDSDSVETANISDTWLPADAEEEDLSDMPPLSKFDSFSENAVTNSINNNKNNHMLKIFNKLYRVGNISIFEEPA